MSAVILRLYPSSRRLLLHASDERALAYVRTAYRRSLFDGAEPERAGDRADIDDGPMRASFNGEPLRPSANDDVASWRSGAYLVDQCVWRSLAADPEWLALYGCALQLGERAVLIAGASGVGKTTLSLALARLGAAILGDEMILVHRRTNVVASVPRALTIHPRSLTILDDERLSRTIRRNAVALDSRAAGLLALEPETLGKAVPCPLGSVVLLSRSRDPHPVVRTPARGAFGLARYLGQKPVTLAATALLAHLLQHTAVYEVATGVPAETAALVAGLVAA